MSHLVRAFAHRVRSSHLPGGVCGSGSVCDRAGPGLVAV